MEKFQSARFFGIFGNKKAICNRMPQGEAPGG
jgi:hypothetical protein